MPIVWCLCAAILFGASTPALKRLMPAGDAFTAPGLLYLGAALAVVPFLRHGGDASLRRAPGVRLRLAATIAVGGCVAPVLLLAGLRRAPAATTALWQGVEPAATAVLAAALFQEHLGRRGWLAVALVVGAAAALAMPSGAGDPVAAACVAGAGICWAIDNNLTATIGGFTPVQITFAKGLVAGTVNLGLGLVVAGLPPALPTSKILLVGALGYGLSTVLYVAGAQALGAARSQMLFATNIAWGALGAWWVLREPMHPAQAVAGAVMAAGLVLLLTSRHAHAHTHEALAHTHSHRHDDGHHAHSHDGLPATTRHTHPHVHEPLTHDHAHVPDLHHRHAH